MIQPRSLNERGELNMYYGDPEYQRRTGKVRPDTVPTKSSNLDRRTALGDQSEVRVKLICRLGLMVKPGESPARYP